MESTRLLAFSDAACNRCAGRESERMSEGDRGDVRFEAMTDSELLRAYLEMRERPPERIKLLLIHAEAIMEREEEL